MSETIHVAVAVIINEKDEACISLRHRNAHQGGLWEFPGGKLEPGESVEQSLAREIKEELNLTICSSRPLITISHQYSDKKVCLHVRKVIDYQGVAAGVENQQVRWVAISALSDFNFPAANISILKSLQLPDRYLITGKFSDTKSFVRKLTGALNNDIRLVQLRLKPGSFRDTEQAVQLITQTAELCEQRQAKLMLNVPESCLSAIDGMAIAFSGIHADSKTLQSMSQRPAGKLFSASCHNTEELQKAVSLGADFAMLSPVHKTASHPEMDAMGWQSFSDIISAAEIPVFALGGVSVSDIETAWCHGAQGIAAISALWETPDTAV